MTRIVNIAVILTLLIFIACERKVNQLTDSQPSTEGTTTGTDSGDSSSSTDTTTSTDSAKSGGTSSGTGDSSSGDCFADGVGDSANNYITINPIIGKGENAGIVQYSSADDPNFQGPGDQEIFLTDSRLNIRVLANSSPGQGTTTTTSKTCEMMAVPYKKLQVKVGIKIQGSSGYQSTYIFDDIDVNGCSEVHEFSITQTSEPIIIEILETKWDYSCTWANNVNDVNAESYCPFSYVWQNDCFSVGLQVATDHTRDIPH